MPKGVFERTKKISEQARLKMRLAKLGKPGNKKGKTASLETRRRLSISHLGQTAWNKGTKGLTAGWPKGTPRINQTGEKNHKWIADRTKLAKRQERNDMAYKEWRMNVWKRDGFKCKIANKDCEGRIEAHHILGWTEYLELRYEVNNGITLCHAHHPRKRIDEKRLSPYFQELIALI